LAGNFQGNAPCQKIDLSTTTRAEIMDGMLKSKHLKSLAADHLLPEVLTAFPGIHVWVSQLDPPLVADGLDRELLWSLVQQRLVQAGLPVPKQRGWQQVPSFPCLGVLVHADQAQVSPPFYIFSVEVFYVQKITLAGLPSSHVMRMAWCREAVGDVRGGGERGFDWSVLHNTVGSLVDQFLQEALASVGPVPPARVCN
jgi:hypothetical protein